MTAFGAQTDKLIEQLLAGHRRALARCLSLVESRRPGFREVLRSCASRTGRAHRIGITGSPGVGKSTFITALTQAARNRGQKVAILAIDPSSPFTGGALLGDRVRMTDLSGDAGVFMRSMATRGALGGLSSATGDALDLLDAAGFDLILIETVGAGQVDFDVIHEAETVLVLFAPGAGDGIQAMKSGIMEVADFWLVNKADDSRAERVRSEIVSALMLHAPPEGLDERVRLVSSLNHEGIEELLTLLETRHATALGTEGFAAGREERLRHRIVAAASEQLEAKFSAGTHESVDALKKISLGQYSVHDAADELLMSFDAKRSDMAPDATEKGAC